MKATLEFNLPEDRYEYALANNARELLSALQEIHRSIRKTLKYSECASDETRKALEELRQLLPYALISKIEDGDL